MDRLRRECPWDREQTHASLAPYLLEETYETLEAIDSGDPDHLREELGDLLLQVYFHSRIAAEHTDGFDIDDVATGIAEKLIRRHPHVFADVDAADAEAVEANWDQIKAAEKQRSSALDGVPHALPALALASKLIGRATRAKLVDDDPSHDSSLNESPDELTEEGLGEALFALTSRATAAGLDPEQALRRRTRIFEEQIRAREVAARSTGSPDQIHDAPTTPR